MKCVVCGNSRKGEFIGPQATFHCFPRKENLKRKWLIVIGKEPDTIVKHAIDCVCSNHFPADSYSATATKKRKLLPNAIPSIISLPETYHQSSYSSSIFAEPRQIPWYHVASKVAGFFHSDVSEESQPQMFTQSVKISMSETTTATETTPSKSKFILVTPRLLGIFKNRSTQTADYIQFSDKEVQCQLMPAWTSSPIKKSCKFG